MASVKVKFRPPGILNRPGTIYYQLIHDRKVRQVVSGYHIYPAEWNSRHSKIIVPENSGRREYLLAVRAAVRLDIDRFVRIIRILDAQSLILSVDDIVDSYKRFRSDATLFNFMNNMIARLRDNGHIRTSETYKAAKNSFKNFLESGSLKNTLQEDDIMLDTITPELMESYEAWQRMRGLSPNTTSFYLRILRAVYNRAVDKKLIDDLGPFRHVYTGIERTVKRALPLETLRKIKSVDLEKMPSLDYARDMFMLSFYLRGMSFIDMAFLRKIDLKCGRVTYRRRKTGQLLSIAWTKEMQDILDKYPQNTTEYLLPIIRSSGTVERYTYRNVAYSVNCNLKRLAEITGVNIPLTLYVARHSWASAAKVNGIPISIISEGMGHDSETTTMIYLASLETSAIDEANDLIITNL